MKLWIPVAAGLEAVVKRQIYALGYQNAPAFNGRIMVEGDWEDVARLNVFLRSGERVLVELGRFKAETFDELYDGVYAIPFENWLDTDARILMDGKSFSSRLVAIKSMGGVVKKSIIRRLADKKPMGRTTFSETGARSIIGFSAYKDEIVLTLDTSGDGLHKRGYRSLAYTAPLKETLAAAIIDLSFYHPDSDHEKPFADIFCGSGTLPIEAALKALKIAPGGQRDFDFCHWSCAPKNVLKRAQDEAKSLEDRSRKVNIYGSDISPEAISIAKYHAKRAGVENAVHFSVGDMRSFRSELPYGVLISNPPYGERLSSEAEIKELYRDLGKTYFSLPDWSAYILTSFHDFERYFKKSADRKKKLYNANLECSLYTYFGKKPVQP